MQQPHPIPHRAVILTLPVVIRVVQDTAIPMEYSQGAVFQTYQMFREGQRYMIMPLEFAPPGCSLEPMGNWFQLVSSGKAVVEVDPQLRPAQQNVATTIPGDAK
jgi:hypothetical protein